MLISFFLMIIISTSPTVPTQPSPRFHVEAWLPFRNCEMDYCFFMFLITTLFGMECSGVEWSGVKWNGVERSGVEWSGVE